MAGLETRPVILPEPKIPAKVPGIFGPDYSFADSLRLPGEVGVRDDGSIDGVINAAKGAAYYIDMIGFGESSGMSGGLGVQPIGVNTFIETGEICSNGAKMWMYNAGIPTGNAAGARVAQGLASAGLPQLRGIAPGILEDVQTALDPVPIMSAVFGTGYASCKQVTLQVGDQDGVIQNPATCSYYMDNPETVTKGDGGKSYQTRWVKAQELTQEQYDATPKTICPDGFAVASHPDTDCLKEIPKPPLRNTCVPSAGFLDYGTVSFESKYLYDTLSGIGAAAIIIGICIATKALRKN